MAGDSLKLELLEDWEGLARLWIGVETPSGEIFFLTPQGFLPEPLPYTTCAEAGGWRTILSLHLPELPPGEYAFYALAFSCKEFFTEVSARARFSFRFEDPEASTLWSFIYGGSGDEEIKGLTPTSYGGWIVVGATDSFSEDLEAWIMKVDHRGQPLWQKRYGGPNDETLLDIKQTTGGGFIAVGYTRSFGKGGTDFWGLKLSSSGDIEWQKTYGGPGEDQAWSVEIVPEGYLVAGVNGSYNEQDFKRETLACPRRRIRSSVFARNFPQCC